MATTTENEVPIDDRDVRVPPIATVMKDVVAELASAMTRHPTFNSAHEGYAVILEELDELWEEIKLRGPDTPRMYGEAKQVAAMAMRFMLDVCSEGMGL